MLDLGTERSAAALTNTQRKYLINEKEPTHERQFKNRMKERVRNSVIDGSYLLTMPIAQQKSIFEPLNDREGENNDWLENIHTNSTDNAADWDGLRELDPDKLRMTENIHTGSTHWLAFLYSSITEANPVITQVDASNMPTANEVEEIKNQHGEQYFDEYLSDQIQTLPRLHFDFETMLREAVELVAEHRGEIVSEFDLRIETEPKPEPNTTGYDTTELLKRFNNNDPKLTYAEVRYLHSNDEIDEQDIQQYHDEVTAK